MINPAWTDWLTNPLNPRPLGTTGLPAIGRGRWTAWLVAGIYAGCLTAFAADVTSTNMLAFGVFYAPLVGTAIFYEDRRAVWVLSAIASIMVVLGAVFPSIDPDLETLIGNRLLALSAILATAVFVRHARRMRDELADQTSRAEAAERIKSEVLTNLSQEIRAPLYSMLGVLELISAAGHPDQKAALTMVRGDGRRLVATIDNLVDLTQSGTGLLPRETLDLGVLLHQAAEAVRPDAAARQLDLSIAVSPGSNALVLAHPWAARRVIENFLADAIAYTAPGGQIVVRTVAEPGHFAAEVRDSGTRPPLNATSPADPAIARLMPSAMGQALNQRLARAMGARLVFSSEPGTGSTARLVLPMPG